MNEVNIGKEIKTAVYKSDMSISQIARTMGYTRQGIYLMFHKKSMDTSTLQKLGDVLGVNFFLFYLFEK